MPLTRRQLLQSLGAGTTGLLAAPIISARGREALAAARIPRTGQRWLDEEAAVADVIRLSSNENPRGPSADAMRALSDALGSSSRYPFAATDQLRQAIARQLGVADDQVLVGCGSTEILVVAVEAFTSAGRHLVTAAPTFEQAADHAQLLGHPVRAIPVDASLRLDLAAMAAAAPGAGLVFVNNPNNPTGTLHGAPDIEAFVRRVLREAPDARVLIDEAYHEYVEDPSYRTAIPLALENPRVIVSRTFSKVHGLAGLRVGYAVGHATTLEAMGRYRLDLAVNALGAAAAMGALAGAERNVPRERALNREAREYTQRWFEQAGFRVVPSSANFLMADIRRDPADFQRSCRELGVQVGRPFPPLRTHARVSIGTVDEMRAATDIFARVLKR